MNPTLVRLFEEYEESHRHPMNRLTHKIAIPMIVFHILAMLDWIPLARVPILGGAPLSAGHVGAGFAIAWYLFMSPKLGAILGVLFAICFPIGWYTPKAGVVVIAIVGWIIQFSGHFVFEKRSPAFFSNLIQTLVGPIFFLALLTGDWSYRRSERPVANAAS